MLDIIGHVAGGQGWHIRQFDIAWLPSSNKGMQIWRLILVAGVVCLQLVIASSPAVAQHAMDMDTPVQHDANSDDDGAGVSSTPNDTSLAHLNLRLTNAETSIRQRLAGAQLQACQHRQSKISQYMATTIEQAKDLRGQLTTLAERADSFASQRGVAVIDYAAITADLQSYLSATDAAINNASTQADTFSCQSNGPKAQLQVFVQRVDEVRQVLKNYQDAIRSLTQATEQAYGTMQRHDHVMEAE